MTSTMPPMQTLPETSADADRECIAAWVAHGDREALQAVFERHAATALRLATSRLGNLSDADDAVQHAFIGVMRGARHYRPERGSVRGWLMTAVLNACVEQRRSETRRLTREAATAPSEEAPRGADPDLRDALKGALAQLPEHQRQPVELRYLAGLDFPEIAAALGRNERTVRGQVSRGLDTLRETCASLGLRRETSALGAALAALPGPPAEASIRLAAVAASGPSAAAATIPVNLLLLPGLGLLLAVIAALLVLQPWRRPQQSGAESPPPPAVAALEPAAAPEAPRLIAGRERRTPDRYWWLPDDASTTLLPVIAVGAARAADDSAGVGTAWWEPTPLPAGDWWTVPPAVKTERRDWTPERLVRAPRAGEDCYAVCVTPPSDEAWQRSLVFRSVVATSDGWHLVIDGVRASRAAFPGVLPTGPRAAFAVPLGRLAETGARITAEVRWRDQVAPTTVLPDLPRIERGEVRALPSRDDQGGAALLDRFRPDPAGAKPATATDAATSHWVLNMPMHIRSLTAAQAPERYAGLIETTRHWLSWHETVRTVAGTAAIVLGPPLRREDLVSVRGLGWKGSEVTARIAVWTRSDTPADGERRRPLVPVWIERPSGVTGPVTVHLAWEHYVADDASGTYRLQEGVPAFAGTTRLDGVDLPDPSLPPVK